MRTTVEITDEQHEKLVSLAAKRGLRGFSPLVQEALDLYLADERERRIQETLKLRGSLTHDEGEQLLRSIEEAWATWPEP